MANPYGIEEVSIGNALGAYQAGVGMRRQREADMRVEADRKRAETMRDVIAKAMGGGGQASGGAAPAASPSSGAASVPQAQATTPGNPLLDPTRQQAVISGVASIDPTQAMELTKTFAELNKGQLDRMKDVMAIGGRIAFELRRAPPVQREVIRAQKVRELQGVVPELAQLVATLSLDDATLEGKIGETRDIEKLIDSTTPKIITPPAGGTVYEIAPPSPYGGATQSRVIGGETPPETVLATAQEAGVISPEDSARMRAALGPNGQAEFERWKKQNNVVEGKRLSNGQMAYLVNGQWYDNPEGR
jgi:hypothetical protein